MPPTSTSPQAVKGASESVRENCTLGRVALISQLTSVAGNPPGSMTAFRLRLLWPSDVYGDRIGEVDSFRSLFQRVSTSQIPVTLG